MAKRALVVGAGGFFGAYGAGVTATLCRGLGPNYFDTIYGCSAGGLAAAMYAANQPDFLENLWRNLVDGKKVIDFSNIIRGRTVLNLEHLADIFKNKERWFDFNKGFSSSVNLILVVTEIGSGQPRYLSANSHNFLDLLKASAAIPLLHNPVSVDGKLYIDGALADPFPIMKAFYDGHDEILAVHNIPKKSGLKKKQKILLKFALRAVFENEYNLDIFDEKTEKHIEKNPFITVIRPRKDLPLRLSLDTNRQRINKAFDIGVKDARNFLKKYSRLK